MNVKFNSTLEPDWDKFHEYIQDSFDQGQLSNFGPNYDRLCKWLRNYLKVDDDREIILTSSGHTALMAAYAALDLDCVYVPAFTFESTLAAARMTVGYKNLAHPDRYYECIHAEAVHEHNGCINPRTMGFRHCFGDLPQRRAVAVTTALSTIPDFSEFDYLKEYDPPIFLVVDGAPSFGTPGIYNNGDAFCISFHATKSFPIGEGGALIIKKEYAAAAKDFINFSLFGRLPKDPVQPYNVPGMNGKLSEYACAIGMALTEKIHEAIDNRKKNAFLYKQELGDLVPPSSKGLDTIYQSLPIFLRDRNQATDVVIALNKAGVERLQYYRPLKTGEKYNVSSSLYERNVCLPVHQDVTTEEVMEICSIILKHSQN